MLKPAAMKLRHALAHVAHIALVTMAGCSSSGAVAGADGGSGSSPDAGEGGVVACGGCNCGTVAVPMGNATPAQACALAASLRDSITACDAFCGNLNHNGGQGYDCTLPPDYVAAYQAAQPDGGSDGGADAGAACPAWTGDVVVQCGILCLGRRTAGADAGRGLDAGGACDENFLGAVFAERARLEQLSVHAFARLELELRAHGAPPPLLRDVRRARRDEVRHAAMTARLARRYGGASGRPMAFEAREVRSLLAVAIENAVEGCVRETYGAAVGLIEARGSRDPQARRAMTSIAADECRHAELSWEIARWIAPRLTAAGRQAVSQAMREAVAELARGGDAQVVRLLSDHVWCSIAAAA